MTAILLLSLATFAKGQLNSLYPIVPGMVSTTNVTTPIVDNTAFGACECDRTLNSCDVYCCCDQDCSAPILQYWQANYPQFCALSYTGQEYKPLQQCID